MKLYTTADLWHDERFNFFHHIEYTVDEMFEKKKDLGGLLIEFPHHSEFEFQVYLRTKLFELIKKYHIYVLLVENFPKRKSRIRSLKKNLYAYKKGLGKQNIFEIEIDYENDKTIIASMLKLKPKNIDFFFENVYGSKFVAAYFSTKGKRTFQNKKQLLTSLIANAISIENRVDIKADKLATNFVKKEAFILRILTTGNDSQNLEFYLPNSKLSILANSLKLNNHAFISQNN